MKLIVAALGYAFLTGVCAATELEDIQRTAPIRTIAFTGAHNAVARCIYDRVGGKTAGDKFIIGDRLYIYDSVKGLVKEELSHYAITILKTGPSQGSVEWRIIRTTEQLFRDQPLAVIPLSETMMQQFWIPIQECAAKSR